MNTSTRSWLIIFASLMVADLLTTWLVLYHGGQEQNPLVLALGWPAIVALKATLVAVIGNWANAADNRRVDAGRNIVAVAAAIMALVTLWNVIMWVRLVVTG